MVKRTMPLVLVLVLAISCAPKSYSPELARLYNINSLVNTIGTLQSSAIQLNDDGKLATSDTRLIVQFCVGSLQIIKTLQADWKIKVLNQLRNLRESLTLDSVHDKFDPILTLVEKIVIEVK